MKQRPTSNPMRMSTNKFDLGVSIGIRTGTTLSVALNNIALGGDKC